MIQGEMMGLRFHCSDETSFFDVRDQIAANTEPYICTQTEWKSKAMREGSFLSSISYKRWMDGWMNVIVKMVEGGEGVSGFSRDWNPTSC